MTRRQMEVPGTERESGILELDAAAERFKASSKKRKRAQDAEIADRDVVVVLMKKHKLTTYEDRDAGLSVVLSQKDTVRVDDLNDEEETNETPVEAHRKLEPKNGAEA